MISKHEWVNTLFIALALTICLLTIIDIAYDMPIWEFNIYELRTRIKSFAINFSAFYVGAYGCRRIARYFINKGNIKANWKEYILVYLLVFVILNITFLYAVYNITNMGFRWKEAVLINMVVPVLLFLLYTVIRSRILSVILMEQNLKLEKVKVDQLDTELKFLKSQFHPHFLFNALNTIYFQVDDSNKEAKQSIEQLSDLLRYQLYDIENEVTMQQEINYLRSYIAFQQQRMTKRLVLELYFDPELKDQKIHPLLFQPLIENAFKYVRGEYKIVFEMKLVGNQIQAKISNSISQSAGTVDQKGHGIGIENLKRRLELLYPGKHVLEIKQPENMFVVSLIISPN